MLLMFIAWATGILAFLYFLVLWGLSGAMGGGFYMLSIIALTMASVGLSYLVAWLCYLAYQRGRGFGLSVIAGFILLELSLGLTPVFLAPVALAAWSLLAVRDYQAQQRETD